jgi:hypothetical protein
LLLASISVYLTWLLSPAYQSGLLCLFFLVAFVLAFLPAALGKGRRSSGVKDVLEEGFVSAGVLLEGPGSGE